MLRRIVLIMAVVLALLGAVQTSQAALSAVDPGPYTAATGYFPLYYTDGEIPSTTLDLCLSKAVSSRVAGAPGAPAYMCTLLPNPGIFDDALPIVFPINFPDEAFWFTGDATINDTGPGGSGINLTYVSALEAAFGGGVPLVGDQVSFARIRIRVDVPAAGIYTITHPYGVEVFDVVTPGTKAINMTRDIGIGAPGVFTGALAGDIGPFLRSVNGPYTEINPDTGASETFVGDPNLLEEVTGSPNNTNFIRVEGPGINVQTNLFAVSGRIWSGVRPAPLAVDRSTYSRTNLSQSQVDVFATSSAAGVTISFRDTLSAPISIPMTGDGIGKFYAREANPSPLPPYVIVTAVAPSATPTPLASPVVDLIKITRAVYALDTNTLLIEANSSDKFAPLPTLRAIGFDNLTVDAAGLYTLNVSPVAKPPALVTVISSQGGSDTEPVQIVPTINIAPVANNDNASTTQGVAVVINVVGNDTDLGGAINPATIAIVSGSEPLNGTAQLNVPSPGQVTYTPNASYFGTDSFRYTVADNVGNRSNEATVTIQVNGRPIAGNDNGTSQGEAVNIVVLGNDSDPDENNPLTVANLTQPANGTAVVQANNTVTYTPNNGFSGTNTFIYQARDNLGALSNVATVTVTVTAPGNRAPVAINDTATVRVGASVNIAVLANDSDPDGNPLTVELLTLPANGTATRQINNTVTYASNGGAFPGLTAKNDTFTYQIRDSLGAVSSAATVTVTVNPEVITATAQVRRRNNLAEWTINGTTNVPTGNLGGNVIVVRLNSINGPVIGQATPDNRGRWKISVRNSNVLPVAPNLIAVTSRYTTTEARSFPITVR